MHKDIIADLARSGLTVEDIEIEELPGAYRIVYRTNKGHRHPTMWRQRNLDPAATNKYIGPTAEVVGEQACHPFLSGFINWEYGTKPRMIVEGEKKAACASKYLGVEAIGIGGVWMWVGPPNKRLNQTLHPQLAEVLRPGEVVEVVFDSDTAEKHNLQWAITGLRLALIEHGCIPKIVVIPPNGDEKVGLDDWVMQDPDHAKELWQTLPRTDGLEFLESPASLAHRLGLQVNEDGAPIPNSHNYGKLLTGIEFYRKHIWFNEFLGQFETNLFGKRGELYWQEASDTLLQQDIQFRTPFRRIGRDVTRELRISLRADPEFCRDPHIEWLNGLVWDGKPRIEDCFVRYFGAEDSEYTRAVGIAWWTAVAARGLSPGCQMDNMLVLEGQQGIGKTRSLRALFQEGYIELSGCKDDRDYQQRTLGATCCDFDELGHFRKADLDWLKGFITQKVSTACFKYDRELTRYPRRNVFVGTTNGDDYLKDRSGNRRYWPMRCYRQIEVEELERDREQLFAEAVHSYKIGTPWHFDNSLAQDMQDARMTIDLHAEALESFFENPASMRRYSVAKAHGGNGQYAKSGVFAFITLKEMLNKLGLTLQDGTSHRIAQVAKSVAARHGFELAERVRTGAIEDRMLYQWEKDTTKLNVYRHELDHGEAATPLPESMYASIKNFGGKF